MPDVEFVTGEPDGVEDEVLDAGARRPVPRWVWGLAAVLVAALVVTVLVRQRHTGTPVAAPSAPATTSAPPVQRVLPNLPVSQTYALVGDDRALRLFALSGSSLFAIAPDGQQIGHGVPVQVGDPADAEVELVLDAPHGVVWAVPQNATMHDGVAAGFAEPFATKPFRPLPRITLPGRVESAAVLDGELYVTTDAGLWHTSSPGGPFEQVAGGAGVNDAMLVADPARGRLICVHSGAHGTVARTYGPVGGLSAPMRLPARTISLLTVGRTIWLAGSRHGHGLLTALDPRTLRPGPNVAGGRADVEIQAGGQRSFFVSVGPQLLCLSGTSGRLLRDLGRARGAFAALLGRGFFGTMQALHPVPLGRCPG